MVGTSAYVLEADWKSSPVLVLPDAERWRLEDAFEQGLGPDAVGTFTAHFYGELAGPVSDYPPLSDVGPCFSARAVDALGLTLAENGRLFPIDVDGTSFYAYKLETVLPALDEAASELELHPAGGVFLIRGHVFLNDRLRDATIFALPTTRMSAVYVTQRFVDQAKHEELTGFVFHEVWDGSRPVVGSGLLGRGW